MERWVRVSKIREQGLPIATATFYKDNNLKHALIRGKARESLAAVPAE